MKYARLSLDDLKDLEKEFVDFLVLNGIVAEDWEKLKAEDIEAAEKIIDQFSDVIWESVLRKVEMLELRRKDFLTICMVKDNELTTMVVKTPYKDLDLTKDEIISDVIENIDNHEVTIRKDVITKSASEQLFEFIKVGFYITKNSAYKRLFEKKVLQ